ncbi:MAG: hypothetical protein ACYC9O_19810 [Candidatus Latescibacterota bacterium]
MKRRDALVLTPLSIAGLCGLASRALPQGEITPGLEKTPALSPEPLSLQYLDKIREMLTRIRNTQSQNLLEASTMIARKHLEGRTCWCSWDMGHGPNIDILPPGRNGLPELFTPGYDPQKSRPGDFFLKSTENGRLDEVDAKDMYVVGMPVPWGADAEKSELLEEQFKKLKIRPYCDLWIETGMTTVGGVLTVPGMTAPIGPESGIIGMVTFWMMTADACRILAREGKAVPVRGDEPLLDWKNEKSRALRSDPLMDDYFDAVLSQMEMIGAELGCLRKIAKMAVDAVLAGGRVYGYDRYGGFAAEARGRRGGLLMTQGISADRDGNLTDWTSWAGKETPSSKDLIIMGLSRPDDEIDLRCLDAIRKIGAKVVSIGPMIRDNKIPEGRTVPKETDLHAGAMCDTYGLFAIPGFERKICPTSGPLLNQMFWACCMEMVEEIRRRTGGDVPGALYSVALKGGWDHFRRMIELFKKRGY